MSMFLIVFLLFGALAFYGMSLDLMPNIDIPYVTVQTVYAGAGPKEIETQITKKIEDEISTISKIEKITSYSMEGLSFVIIEFKLDKDVDVANQEVKDKVDAIINDLPDDADLPVIEKINLQEFPIIDVVLSGDMPIVDLWEIADKKIKDRFSQIPGVARADITGGQEREIQVLLNDRTVFQNNISLQQLSAILASQNLDMPGGYFQKSEMEYTVRLKGELQSTDELAEIEIPTSFGYKRLKDIAEIKDAGAEVRERSSYFNNIDKINNDNVILLSLVKNSEGNTVQIAKSIYEVLPAIEATLPAGCKLDVVTDKSTFIRSTVNDTISNIILGIILTGLVLLIFLHDIRSTIIVALAMPMSILSAFMFMDYLDFTKNIMTLMGLSTSVGILVSNAVVVLENIFRHKEAGMNRKDAAAKGTSEIVVAVIASTATNIAVFLPIASMEGLIGQFFVQFAMTVTIATLFSLLISFTLTPMMAGLILPDKTQKQGRLSKWIEKKMKNLENGYTSLLHYIMHTRKRSFYILLASLMLFVITMMFSGRVGFEFAPMLDEGDIAIEVELPVGYNLDQSAVTMEQIENILKQESSVKHILTTYGKLTDLDQGTNLAKMQIKLIDVDKRALTTDETANKFIVELQNISNARIRVSAVSSMEMSGQAPITFYLKGLDNDELNKYKDIIVDKIKDIPGLVNLNTSSRSGKPEISIIPDRKKIADAGLNVYDIAIQLRGAFTALVSTQYKEGGEEYDLRVMLDDVSLDTPEEVANITVFSNGNKYTLSQLAKIDFTDGYSRILHVDKYKSIEFTASSASGVPLGNVTSEIDLRLADIMFEPGYSVDWGGSAKRMNDTVREMLLALIIAIVLTYMLLAAILENLRQPLLVLGTFPLAMIGVIGSMVLTGSTMNLVSMMSIIMLLGIVVNNAILILDHANMLMREKNMSIHNALLESCPLKLRPILMSSLAIILGMLPMALGMGDAAAEMRQPMGIVTIGGLVVSTVMTLVIIPAIYNMSSKARKAYTESQEGSN